MILESAHMQSSRADTTGAGENTVTLHRDTSTRNKQIWLVPGDGQTTSFTQRPRAFDQKVVAFNQRYLRD
jgi:hypothetical protein